MRGKFGKVSEEKNSINMYHDIWKEIYKKKKILFGAMRTKIRSMKFEARSMHHHYTRFQNS